MSKRAVFRFEMEFFVAYEDGYSDEEIERMSIENVPESTIRDFAKEAIDQKDIDEVFVKKEVEDV